MHKREGITSAGLFRVGTNANVHGQLTLRAGGTKVDLTSSEWFDVRKLADRSLFGTLHDLTSVSCLHWVARSAYGNRSRGGVRNHTASLIVDFVVLGDRHLTLAEPIVKEIRFVIDDATALFNDFRAFGAVINARQHIRRISNASRAPGEPRVGTGSQPEILYFTGKRKIFSAQTVLGTISATHNPSFPLPGPRGLNLTNVITVDLRFKRCLVFDEAMSRMYAVLRFMEIIVGRPQNVLDIAIATLSNGAQHHLEVYGNWLPKRDPTHELRECHPIDILIDPVENSKQFASVLRQWLRTNAERGMARMRFCQSIGHQNFYTIDRVVGAANAFDILPADAVAASAGPDPAMESAKKECVRILKLLPDGPDKEGALNGIGRLGASNLRKKIERRASFVLAAMNDQLPELETVIRESVKCRNYFVHGTETTIDYGEHSSHVQFFTDALEFLFGAAELIEAGWDAAAWSKRPSVMAHPFARFRLTYRENLAKLKSALAQAKESRRRRRGSNLKKKEVVRRSRK